MIPGFGDLCEIGLLVEAGLSAQAIGIATLNGATYLEMVFKDGAGYDTAALLASVRGHYGEY